jgi:hypothetical protein
MKNSVMKHWDFSFIYNLGLVEGIQGIEMVNASCNFHLNVFWLEWIIDLGIEFVGIVQFGF